MVHIIAEAGTNHNGSEQEAQALIDIASRAGADSMKVQIINPWGLYLPGEYEYGHYDIHKVIALRHQTVLEDAVYVRLNAYAADRNIALSASVFDEQGLELLESLDPPYVKLASCDLNNLRFLRQVASTCMKMIVSTGMSTLADVEKAVAAISEKRSLDSVVLMHCVSVYPAKTEQANLSFLSTLKEEFGTEIGFSDHTQTSLAAVMALSLGATWFEKHFTRDRTLEGLDHAYAMEEEPLAQYVSDLRAASTAMIPREDKISEAEFYTRRRARRALYASRDLEAGTILCDEDVLCVRPEGPMDADQIDDVIGRPILVPMQKHDPFEADKLG